ncbi:MAG TPA: hypothetical protein PKD83_09030 [Ignavibacteria bacterium]|nr:hypothetical protein [Ignavibacteria bacterium]
MQDKKPHNKNIKESRTSKKKADPDPDEEFDIKDDHKVEEMLEEEMPGEMTEEDDEEFIHQVKEFEKIHTNAKMVNIYSLIGKPKFRKFTDVDKSVIKEELDKVFLLLEKYNIIVHFHNDYSEMEKYRFITEEIFKEVAEYDKKHNHITFVYEDYHPEMADDDEDEEVF